MVDMLCTKCKNSTWMFHAMEALENDGACRYCVKGHTHPEDEKGEVKLKAHHMRRQLCILVQYLEEGSISGETTEHALNVTSVEELWKIMDRVKEILQEKEL